MRDLGTPGGTIGFANWLNNADDVAGTGDLAGDRRNHPFLWNGTKMIDLGTLGGANGAADLADGTHHAFLCKTVTCATCPLSTTRRVRSEPIT